MDAKIQIGGLTQLSRGLKAIDSGAPKELRLAFNKVANILVDEVRPEIPFVSGRARASLKARSTRTSARVSAGGKGAEYYPWLDFGGEGKRKGRPPARTYINGGRYFYPTLDRIKPEIEKQLQAAISAVIDNAGLEED